MSFNTGNMTAPMDEELIEFTPVQRRAAQLTVARHAVDAADAVELLKMLGLFPGEEAAPVTTPLYVNSHLA